MLTAMTSRHKPKLGPGFVPRASESDDAKDRLLCRLEQQQTVFIEKIERLKRECDELESLRKRFALIYERSPIGYITFNKAGRIHDINETALRLLGYERERFLRLPLTFLVHPQDYGDLLDHLFQCEQNNGPSATADLRLRTKDRGFVKVELVSTPFTVMRGQAMYLTAIVDMTEHDHQQRALAETRDFAEAIVETVRHPLAVLDSDLKIISVNRALTDFFHRPAQYVRGRVLEVLLNLWWSGNELRSALEKVLVKGKALENFRLEVEPPDIGRRILFINARPLQQKEIGPQRLLVSLEDVTELELAREALRKANEELERRVTERTQALLKSYDQMEAFCYSIAHDLRAPLRSMTGFSELLVEEFAGQMTETGKDYAGRIQRSAEHMDHLIRDLLSYGRLNTEPLTATDVDLGKVLRDVVTEYEKDIRERRAKVRRKGRLPRVHGHPSVLHIVLANLISNGLKFVAPGVRPQIEVFAERRDEWTRVWVADNGIGIAPEDHGKVFGVFQRLHHQNTYPGTGIGLAIVAKGVERMGGHLGLESEPGKGSRFWFEVPVRGGVQCQPSTTSSNESAVLIGANRGHRKREVKATNSNNR